jgi:hypothetical protein
MPSNARPVVLPTAAPVQGFSPTPLPTSDDAPSPTQEVEASPTPSPEGGEPSAAPPVTRTEALWMLRFTTGRDFPVSTVAGPTSLALRAFQKSSGLEETGRVDDATVAQLSEAVRGALGQLGYGGGLRAALRPFQRESGLSVDGEFGQRTCGALTAAMEVRRSQEALRAMGAYKGISNGRASDPEFKAALERFQRERGLKVTATLDDATRRALASAPPAPTASPLETGRRGLLPWLGGFALGVAATLAGMAVARARR